MGLRDAQDGNHVPVREHRPYWLMAMYYPGRVSLSNGPTAVMPQTQYWATNHEHAYQSENRLDKVIPPCPFLCTSSRG